MDKIPYSARDRREYIGVHLTGKFRWRSLHEKGAHGATYAEIATDVARHFRREPPTPMTIARDVNWLREAEAHPDEAELSEAQRLLLPDNFPEWRARFFRDPATGKPYETPQHQLAWFHVFVALAFKTPLPLWVHSYLELEVPYHELNKMIADGEHLISLLLLAPPRHGKTELLLHAILWAICYRPQIRIMYVAGILSTSKQNTTYIKSELESNEELIRLYGPFRSDDLPWSTDQLFVQGRATSAKAPTLLPAGKGTNLLSRDADLIVVDDPQDIDAAESETQTNRDFVWLTTQVMTRREPHTALLAIGSHLPSMSGDLWWQVKTRASEIARGRHKLMVVEQKAHDYARCDPINDPDHTKCILWPSLRPFWFLEAQRAALGDILFEACYNQSIRDSKIEFFGVDLVRSLRPEGILTPDYSFAQPIRHCEQLTTTVLGFDPAAGQTRGASESALSVLSGCKKCGVAIVSDYWHARVSPETHAGTIINYVKSYNVSRVRIEINAYQKALARDPELTRAASRLGFMIDSWITDERKNDPMLGIPMMERAMRDGTLLVPYATPSDQIRAEDLLKALIRWPKRPNDIPMSLWLALGIWRVVYEEYNNLVPDVMDGWEGLSEFHQENVYTFDTSGMVVVDHPGIRRPTKLFG